MSVSASLAQDWRYPRSGSILMGAGCPDPSIHPVEALDSCMREALASRERTVLGYAYDWGDIRLRQALTERHAARDGARITPEQVVLTNGSSGAFALVAQALVAPGDVVLVEPETYIAVIEMFRRAGATVVSTAFDEGGLMPDALEETLAKLGAQGVKPRLLYTIASCHNPTGAILSEDRRRRIAALAERHDFLVVQDDTYGELRFTDAPVPTFLSLAPEHGVHIGSFSKTMAPGLRAGWAAASAKTAEAIATARTDLGTSPLTQRSIALFMEKGGYARQVEVASDLYRQKRDRLITALEHHCGNLCTWTKPEGGFFLWCEMRRGTAEHLAAAAHQDGLVLIPGNYFRPSGEDDGHFRLSYSELPICEIEEGVQRLATALARCGDRETAGT